MHLIGVDLLVLGELLAEGVAKVVERSLKELAINFLCYFLVDLLDIMFMEGQDIFLAVVDLSLKAYLDFL